MRTSVVLTTLIRDFLVDEGLCSAARAIRLADRFERSLRGCDWIETGDGVTFERVRGDDPDPDHRAQQLAF